nr:hypothetical protein [Tanacetum cinerariifolium]
MEGEHVLNGLAYKMTCISSKLYSQENESVDEDVTFIRKENVTLVFLLTFYLLACFLLACFWDIIQKLVFSYLSNFLSITTFTLGLSISTVRPDRTDKPDRPDRNGPNIFQSDPRSGVLDQFGLRSDPVLPKTRRLCCVGPDRAEDRPGLDRPRPDRTISVRSSEIDKSINDHDKAIADIQATLAALMKQQEQSIKQQEQLLQHVSGGSLIGSSFNNDPKTNRPMRIGKVEFPRFSRVNVEAWIYSRFFNAMFEDPMEEIASLIQDDDLHEYNNAFDALLNKVEDEDEACEENKEDKDKKLP